MMQTRHPKKLQTLEGPDSMPIARDVMNHSTEQTLMFSTGGALSGMYDHLGCPQTAAEFLSLRAIMLCSTTVMVSRRVEFTIIRLCVSNFGMLMQSFPSPEIPDCIDFSQPSIRALGDVEVPISVGNNLEITQVSPFANMSA